MDKYIQTSCKSTIKESTEMCLFPLYCSLSEMFCVMYTKTSQVQWRSTNQERERGFWAEFCLLILSFAQFEQKYGALFSLLPF